METQTTNELVAKQTTVVRNSLGLAIAGTRITLYTIMDYLKADWPPHLIRDWFDLTDGQMKDILAYLETHRQEVEAEYQQVVAYSDELRQYWEKQNQERFAKIATLPPPPGREVVWAKLQTQKAKLAQA